MSDTDQGVNIDALYEVEEIFRQRAAKCKGPHVPECDCNIYKLLQGLADALDCDNCERGDCNSCNHNDCEVCDDRINKEIFKNTISELCEQLERAEKVFVKLQNSF